ncbi:Phosphoribosylaminoimidazole carboxylase, chloroplastic [Glycine soja]|uniref:phosphoribosylaminoimidazole carboxylase n=1 Tax=Glycine soja TaxID=3848 RepID=A0A0B2PDR1_GLYSO|nr:Phosphoribosylaminoimidazole carboxylase, chloroplastic [Glycine soja]
MGSDSDLPVMKSAAEILEMFGVPHEVRIVSAHKTPELVFSYASSAHERGIQVIIAGVGGAAHLAGMVVALTPLLVIGIPVRASTLDGIDSLLSIVQVSWFSLVGARVCFLLSIFKVYPYFALLYICFE